MARLQLSKACNQYGASLGRANHPNAYDRGATIDVDAPVRIRLQRVPLDSGGYDSGGAYWGFGLPLYRAWNDEHGIELWLRAFDREDAKARVRETYARAMFYR